MPVSAEFPPKAWEVGDKQSWGETLDFSLGSLITGYLCSMKDIPIGE